MIFWVLITVILVIIIIIIITRFYVFGPNR
jgi:hypothetical protein